jgi:hypothetical protein
MSKIYSITLEQNQIRIVLDDSSRTVVRLNVSRGMDVDNLIYGLHNTVQQLEDIQLGNPLHRCPVHNQPKFFDVPTSMSTTSRVFNCGCSTLPQNPRELCQKPCGCSNDKDEVIFRKQQIEMARKDRGYSHTPIGLCVGVNCSG